MKSLNNKNGVDDCLVILEILKKTLGRDLLPCERAIFNQYYSSRKREPVSIVIGRTKAEQIYRDLLAKLRDGKKLFTTDQNVFLNAPIHIHGISVRLRYSLRRAGCGTFSDVIQLNEAHFLRVPGFGTGSLKELSAYLRKAGLKLSDH